MRSKLTSLRGRREHRRSELVSVRQSNKILDSSVSVPSVWGMEEKDLITGRIELLPCPFCGFEGEDMVWRDKNGAIDLIEHPNTDCILSDIRCEDPEQWNQRANNK